MEGDLIFDLCKSQPQPIAEENKVHVPQNLTLYNDQRTVVAVSLEGKRYELKRSNNSIAKFEEKEGQDHKGEIIYKHWHVLDVNHKDYRGRTALLRHRNKNPEMIRLLAEEFNADLNVPNKDGRTPMMKAAEMSEMKVLTELRKLGADMDEKNECDEGKTLLHQVVSGNKTNNSG